MYMLCLSFRHPDGISIVRLGLAHLADSLEQLPLTATGVDLCESSASAPRQPVAHFKGLHLLWAEKLIQSDLVAVRDKNRHIVTAHNLASPGFLLN